MPLNCPGINQDYIAINTPNLNLSGGLSVSVWICPDANPAQNYSVAVSRQFGTGSVEQFGLGYNNSNQFFWSVSDSAGTRVMFTAALPTYSVWYHLVGVVQGGGVANGSKLYINGVLGNQTTVAGALCDSRLPIIIANNFNGNPGSPSESYKGQLQDVRVYSRTLPPAEVVTMYANLGVDGIVYGLVG
jgi:hypothetical protein